MKVDYNDIWEGGSLNEQKGEKWNYNIQKMVDSYNDEPLFPQLKLVLMILALIVAVIFFVWLVADFAMDRRYMCSKGDFSACVEYQWLLRGTK